MFSRLMPFVSIKTIAVLFAALLLSGTLNYALYNKIQTNNLLVKQQKQSIEDLNKSIKLDSTIKEIGDNTFKEVIHSVEESNKSFDSILFSLPQIDICEKEINSYPQGNNLEVAKDVKELLVDPDIAIYYDKLHSAYNLQNKH